MNKVLQTAGRVIRDLDDKGIVCLVDLRFSEHRYQQLFPAHWHVKMMSSNTNLANELAQFWGVQ